MNRQLVKVALSVVLVAALAACKQTGGEGEEIVDTEAPTVRISGPSASSPRFVGESFELRGTADDNIEVTKVAITVNGGAAFDAVLGSDKTWTAELAPESVVPLAVTATAHDAAGNASEPARITYQTQFRGESFHIETYNFMTGNPHASVHVFTVTDGTIDRSGRPAGATVTLNETNLPPDADDGFEATMPAPFSPGAPMLLTVKIGDVDIAAEWSMPAEPTLTGPIDGTNFDVGEPISITWEIAEDPEYFKVLLIPTGGVSLPGGGWSANIPGDARSFELDLTGLPTDGTEIRPQLRAYNEVTAGEFTGPVAARSSTAGESLSDLYIAPVFSIGSP